MKRFFRNIAIQVKLAYYTLLDRFDPGDFIDISNPEARVQHRQNAKLASGVRKLVRRLRGMSPSQRISIENLLGTEGYKKTAHEKLEEVRVLDKLNKEPPVRTEDDLVNTVVKKAPIYAKEQELKEVRKALTAVLTQSSKNPSQDSFVDDLRLLKAKRDTLMAEIKMMKDNL